MDFGIGIPSYIRAWREVELAERAGFRDAWFYDSQMIYSDVYATMALAAEHTKHIRLGTLVAVLSNRIPPVTAHAIASINELAPGRTVLGVGTGFTARNVMGMPPIPLRRMREEVAVIRKLVAGEEASYTESGVTRSVRLLHPEGGFVNLRDRIPIYVAANAPKAMKLAGEVGDGWITINIDPKTIAEGRERILKAADAAGRKIDAAHFPVTVLTSACVLKPGESRTSERVKRLIGPFAIVLLHTVWDEHKMAAGPFAPPSLFPLAKAYHDDHIMKMRTPIEKRFQEMHYGHVIFLQPGEDKYITEELLNYGSLVGTPAEIIARIKALEAVGVTNLALHIVGTDSRELIEDLGREVIARM